jgi:hypothetical protein
LNLRSRMFRAGGAEYLSGGVGVHGDNPEPNNQVWPAALARGMRARKFTKRAAATTTPQS